MPQAQPDPRTRALSLAGAMNNNLTTERSHLGVFSTTTFITIGDQYGKKSDPDPRLQGKQFAADFPKGGIAGARPNNSMFDREHKWLYGGEKCVCCTRRAAPLLCCRLRGGAWRGSCCLVFRSATRARAHARQRLGWTLP